MQGNYPSFDFKEHLFLLYKCKSCNLFAVPATVFIGLLLALPVTMIIIGKWTFLSSILFSLFVYMNITANLYSVQFFFLYNIYSCETFIPRYQRITLSITHDWVIIKEIHNHKEFLLFPHDMTDNDFVVERYMQDF